LSIKKNEVVALAELGLKKAAVLSEIGGSRRFRRRLMELGLTPGTEVHIVRTAPFGDPIELEVRGFHISLRRAEAAEILVSPCD
jgi:ferrous iron transport protein A